MEVPTRIARYPTNIRNFTMDTTNISPDTDRLLLSTDSMDVTQVCDTATLLGAQTDEVITSHGDDLFLRQVQRERDCYEAGAKQYMAKVQGQIQEGRIEYTAGGQAGIDAFTNKATQVIVRFLNKDATLLDPLTQEVLTGVAAGGKASAGAVYRAYLEAIPVELTVSICLRVLVAGIAADKSMGEVRTSLARELEQAAKITALREEDADLEFDIKKQAKREGKSGVGIAKLIEHAIGNTVSWTAWETKAKHKMAATLIHAIAQNTGMIELHTLTRGKRKEIIIRASKALLDVVNDRHTRIALTSPLIKPSVIPPKDWTSNDNGVFWWENVSRLRMVKSSAKDHVRDIYEATSDGSMDPVYKAINATQRTAWAINKPVLEVMQWAWLNGDGMGGCLPIAEPVALPPRPDKGAPQEEWDVWSPLAHAAHNHNRLTFSKRLKTAGILTAAEEYAEEDAIYYAYTLDFRGRMYPVQTGLQPQGEDMEKGLLTFAEGVPLTESGKRWLYIHGANEFGVDKVSYDDRVQWVRDNHTNIMLVHEDPITNRWWTEADSPWKFLAFCFEYAEAIYRGAEFVTHLPVSVDGTCNGLQHLSAMVRDQQGADSVNLMPSEKPSDIYGVVARITEDILRDLVQSGSDKGVAASDLLELGITRKETKRSVMVIPYGGTMRACLNYVEQALNEKGLEVAVVDRDQRRAVKGLGAKAVWDAMEEPLGTARNFMKWLQKWARVLAKVDTAVRWKSPSGFPCYQKYMKVKSERVVAFRGETGDNRISIAEETDVIDSQRQASGIAPNAVHSYDAAHMTLTVGRLVELGVEDFALVHDSFGTHASNMEAMQVVLREVFHEMYMEDVPSILASQLMQGVINRDTLLLFTEDMPKLGTWNPEAIHEADYFFS